MLPSRAIRMAAITRLASDPATLAQAADANVIALVKNNFNPGEDLEVGDLELADFDGSTPLAVGLNTQPTAFQPGTDDSVIDLIAPVGGFRWETTGITNLPQTIYGWALLNEALDTVLASGVFETPPVLTVINQVVEVTDQSITLPKNSFI